MKYLLIIPILFLLISNASNSVVKRQAILNHIMIGEDYKGSGFEIWRINYKENCVSHIAYYYSNTKEIVYNDYQEIPLHLNK